MSKTRNANEGQTMKAHKDLFEAAEAAKVERDAANDELRRAWDIDDVSVPNDASDLAIAKLARKAELADDVYAAAKLAAVEAWVAAGSPVEVAS